MICLFIPLALLLVYFSYRSYRGGLDYLAFFRRELEKNESSFTPFATVVAPCRGLDDGLAENLQALLGQNYPAYEVIFVVDAESDAAVPVIERLISRQDAKTRSERPEARAARLVVAGAADGEGQKVHNLRAAVARAAPASEVFVFVDSDARPDAGWLGALVAPLADPQAGASTGYRWFIAEKFGLASELRAVWNASIASALGANERKNFCWGGSMALRRDTFERIGMRERWRGTLSDDFAVTRALHAEGLPVRFVPQALTASVENCTFGELFEFTTRQMKITRVYAPHLWRQSLLGAGLFNLVWLWGVVNLFVYPAAGFAFWFSAAALLLIALFSTGKARLRRRAVRLVLVDYERELRRQRWTQNTLWIVTPAIFFYNCLAALGSRRIVWRGFAYELRSPAETILIKRDTTNCGLPSSDSRH